METVAQSRPRRSIIRRIATVGLSVGMLTGSGWGLYEYMSAAADDSADTNAEFIAHSASSSGPTSASDELKKNLFSTDKMPTTSLAASTPSPAKPAPAPVDYDRYALPPAPPTRPDTANQAETLADERYAPLPPLPPEPKDVDEPQQEDVAAADEPTSDVARGQQPDVNPLRSEEFVPTANTDVSTKDIDAKNGFEQSDSPIAVPTSASDQLVAALDNARPLQQPKQNKRANNRYQSAPIDSPLEPQFADNRRQEPSPPLGLNQTQLAPQEYAAPNVAGPVAGLNRTGDITPTPGLANNAGTGRPGERLLEGAQSPSITVQKLAPAEIQVGKRCTFAVRVQNTGQRTAQNVQIHDEVPLGTELVGTAPRAEVSGSKVVWNLGMLSVGEERTVEMELLPVEEGELGSVATVTIAAQASAKARCTRPELALRLSSGPRVMIGQQQLVQIEIANPGSGDATGVMLLETIPAGVSHEAGPALEFEIGTLRAGESRRLELVLTAEQAGKIQNVMTARADASLQIEASCEFEVIAPELRVTVEGPKRRYLERPATYQVSVENPGTATAKDVQLVTHLPKGLQFVSANNMGEYDAAAHSVYWSLAELPPQERGTVELVALPIEAGQQTLQVATKASQGLEDRTEKQVEVEGLSAVTFDVTQVEGLLEVGGENTYEIRVINQGSKAAANVQVIAIMPAGLRAMSGQGETRHAIQGERVVFAPLPQLAPKADTMYRIVAQAVRQGDQRVTVQVTTDEVQQPITKEVSTRVYGDE